MNVLVIHDYQLCVRAQDPLRSLYNIYSILLILLIRQNVQSATTIHTQKMKRTWNNWWSKNVQTFIF